MLKRAVLLAMVLIIGLYGVGHAGSVSYDFSSNPPPDWVNKVGNWVANSGVYYAQNPGNVPPTFAYLPFDLTDFIAEVDINNATDGGLWLHSSYNETYGWANGILLVAKPGSIYWHVVVDNSYGASLNPGAMPTGDSQVKVVASGGTYSVYLNGSTTPATTLITSAYANGWVGLYQYSSQTFDNFILTADNVPLPGALWLMGSGLLGLAALRRRLKR